MRDCLQRFEQRRARRALLGYMNECLALQRVCKYCVTYEFVKVVEQLRVVPQGARRFVVVDFHRRVEHGHPREELLALKSKAKRPVEWICHLPGRSGTKPLQFISHFRF